MYIMRYQIEALELQGLTKLGQCKNSPDLNAIEPIQNQIKRKTTKKGGFTSRKAIEVAQIKCWEGMLQKLIQSWIERILYCIAKVIRLEGGNLYKEGRLKGQEKNSIR